MLQEATRRRNGNNDSGGSTSALYSKWDRKNFSFLNKANFYSTSLLFYKPKNDIKSFKCGNMGHYKSECRIRKTFARIVENDYK